ncbi:MAG TPA: DUF4423 domain-containing protein [Pseudobdellovibrionaceae bacterium]|nr:DUF4423 domain-containing protein [Pseudobdellovibrionaceae bacterium]
MDLDLQRENKTRSEVVRMLSENFNFSMFSLLPKLEQFDQDPRWMAKQIGISVEVALDWQDLLISCGLWKKNDSGKVFRTEEHIDYYENGTTGTMPDFLSTMATLSSKLTESGPCSYEYEILATSGDVLKDFVREIREVENRFLKRSLTANCDRIVGWSRAVVDISSHNSQKRSL